MTTPPGPSEALFPHFEGPPTPPEDVYNDPLDDIYGSAPSSPVLSSVHPHPHTHGHDINPSAPLQIERNGTDEILSDLPSRRRALDTDAYREGRADNKGQHVQQGFDEGYSLGANLGLRVGYILGVLNGLCSSLSSFPLTSPTPSQDKERLEQARKWRDDATRALAIEQLLGQQWVDEEGIWKWDVRGVEADPTFREVAEQHPVIAEWMERIQRVAREWGVDLERLGVVGQEGEED